MSDTMDKANVLYRVEIKNQDSVKWATIQKLNHGTAVPKPAITEVNRLFGEAKKDLELKVGLIGKKGAYKLVLRVKGGSKHLYDYVLDPNYAAMSESEKGFYENEQIANARLAMEEVEGVFTLTERALERYARLKEQFDDIKEKFERLEPQLRSGRLEGETRFKALSQVKVWINVLSRAPDEMLGDVFKTHSDEISDFRGGGAGRVCDRHHVDDNHSVDVKKRFMEHTKLFKEFEDKCRSFGPKVHETQNSMRTVVELAEKAITQDGVDLEKARTAVVKMLATSADEYRTVVDQATRNMKANELERNLTLTIRTTNAMNVDASIKTANVRRDGLEKIVGRLEKMFKDRIKQIPDELQEDEEVVRAMIAAKRVIDEFKQVFADYSSLTMRALEHLKNLERELAS